MANGIVIDDNSVKNSVGQTNPLPVKLMDSNTGETLEFMSELEQLRLISSAVQEVISGLDFLRAVRGIAADVRVTVLSGTITAVTTVTTVSTVTTVGTVTGITNIGGIPAVQLIPSNQNMVAVLSNINNVTV